MRLTTTPGGQPWGGTVNNMLEDLGYQSCRQLGTGSDQISQGLECQKVQFEFIPKALESCGDFFKIVYTARLGLALRERAEVRKTM